MNHEAGGFDCPGCAWPDDRNGLHLDICENGVKHATWELAPAKADREFFAARPVSELAGWSDYDLEAVGRPAVSVPNRRATSSLTALKISSGRTPCATSVATTGAPPARRRGVREPRATRPSRSRSRAAP
jgi:hypothetical protein